MKRKRDIFAALAALLFLGAHAHAETLITGLPGTKWDISVSTPLSNATKSNASGLTDGALTDIRIGPATIVSRYRAFGVVATSVIPSVTAVEFVQGTYTTSNTSGVCASAPTLQYSNDGTTWMDIGWTISPSYPYQNPTTSMKGTVYRFSGSPLVNVRGLRVICGVYMLGINSQYVNVQEVKVYGPDSSGFTVYTTQLPAGSGNEARYSMGGKFGGTYADVIALRFYTMSGETGAHTCRIWDFAGTLRATVSTPEDTSAGWREISLPTSVKMGPNEPVTIACDNGANNLYPDTQNLLATPITVNGVTTIGPGLYGAVGTLPTSSWNNSSYFRDIRATLSPNTAPSGGTFVASKTTVAAGELFTLSWNVPSAVYCTTGATWSVGGQTKISPIGSATTSLPTVMSQSYPLTCTSKGGSTALPTVTVTAQAAAAPNLVGDKATVAFGNVNPTETGVGYLTVTNTGNAQATISGAVITVPSGQANPFGQSMSPTLLPGESKTATLFCTPPASGSYTGTLTYTYDGGRQISVGLTCTGAGAVYTNTLVWDASSCPAQFPTCQVQYVARGSDVSGGPYTDLGTTAVGVTTYQDVTTQAYRCYVVGAIDATGQASPSANSNEACK